MNRIGVSPAPAAEISEHVGGSVSDNYNHQNLAIRVSYIYIQFHRDLASTIK